MHASDQRWPGLKSAIETVRAILDQLGMFKPWMLMEAPETLNYKGARRRWSPGEKVSMKATVTGGEAQGFVVEPALPEGLVLDESTGEISGELPSDVEIPMETYVVKAKNPAGEATYNMTFAVTAPPPANLEYRTVKSCYTGEGVCWDPDYEGGTPTEWTIEPEL